MRGVAAGLVVLAAAGGAMAQGFGEAVPTPAGGRVTLVLDNPEYFLGETVLVHLVVTNAGDQPFRVNTGGDYRFAWRSQRFHLTATDERGVEATDPHPDGSSMGGISSSPSVPPGGQFFISQPLHRYRRIDKPGTYRLRAGHDLGWTKAPTAEATVVFKMPTPEQVRAVVAAMDRLPKESGRVNGQRQEVYADFATLTDPAYLPVLAPRAKTGDTDALKGVAHIIDPAATETLIGLLADAAPAFARTVLGHVNDRLPDPRPKDEQKAGFFGDPYAERRWRAERAWRPAFAPRVRAAAVKLITADADAETLRCAAATLEAVGEKEDGPAIVRGLDRAIALLPANQQANGVYRHTGAFAEWLDAARGIGRRGMAFPTAPKTAGERVLFAFAVGQFPAFRPDGWATTYLGLLRADVPCVREQALAHLPKLADPALVAELPKLLADADPAVARAACQAVAALKPAAAREPLVKLLRTCKDAELMQAAGNAAFELVPAPDRVRILADRLDDEAVAGACLDHLMHTLITGWSGLSSHGLRADQLPALKAEWQLFLRDRADDLKAGKPWRFDDPTVPVARLLPGFMFTRREEQKSPAKKE